jgi:hypothetical protein
VYDDDVVCVECGVETMIAVFILSKVSLSLSLSQTMIAVFILANFVMSMLQLQINPTGMLPPPRSGTAAALEAMHWHLVSR